MPTYNFKNNKTGEEWEEFFTISGKEEFLEQNSHIQQLPSIISIVSDVGGIKNDSGWKDNMSRIADAHPGSHRRRGSPSRSSHEPEGRAPVPRRRKRSDH